MRIICGFPVRVNLGTVFYQHKGQGKAPRYILDPDEEDGHPLGKLNEEFLTAETAHIHPTDLLGVIKARAQKAKKNGKSFWSTFDPVRRISGRVREKSFDKFELDDHSRMIIDMLDSDYAQCRGLDLPPRAQKRKRDFSERYLDFYEGDNED
ncbi:hypothetical protein C8R41DRAFT_824318 [Lentinula lateritia]|uniref:Uncharacterized protein n=1 Tax=Lentinula lateritia TaxID=40482 RepID=A0ABQ8VKR3_9AGAR|nr:hypothetical protein C8R41DRAFT_824318 [Lentinula lateritia]